MSLRDRIKSKSASLVKRRTITLPESGETVQVRSLMLGEVNRIGEQKGATRQTNMQIALAAEDPENNQPIWPNPNDKSNMDEIEALPTMDGLKIVEVSNELSGIGEKAEAEGKDDSSETMEN